MSQVVWKFYLSPLASLIRMPRGARIIHVGVRDGSAYVWALCNPAAPMEPRYVVSVPTGQAVPGYATEHVGTFVIDDGLVFHVFEGPAFERDGVTRAGTADGSDAR